MAVHLYKIECLTNLHVGSGDINYNVVDNEVEKDVVTGYPIIHSSGLKGALREYAAAKTFKDDKAKVCAIFGQDAGSNAVVPGSYKFFDSNLISRPMRVSGSDSMASISVFTITSINDYLSKTDAFGCNKTGLKELDESLFDFSKNSFLSNVDNISIEGEKAGKISEKAKQQLSALSNILGHNYAIVKGFDNYDLPVLARNYLENGISKNLWYEEVVPHGSVFYTFIITPEEENELDFSDVIQIGGHASIGYGFTRFTKLN